MATTREAVLLGTWCTGRAVAVLGFVVWAYGSGNSARRWS
jgi:hypothetical protein